MLANAKAEAEISIHALRKECDHDYFTSALPWTQFLSTHSVRSATLSGIRILSKTLNISIHALRKECDS